MSSHPDKQMEAVRTMLEEKFGGEWSFDSCRGWRNSDLTLHGWRRGKPNTEHEKFPGIWIFRIMNADYDIVEEFEWKEPE
jgi:hypothetical protein